MGQIYKRVLDVEELIRGYELLNITPNRKDGRNITLRDEDILVSYIEGQTPDEIAKEMGLTKGRIMQILTYLSYKIKFRLKYSNKH
jgi:uncharacterized protein (DUF433 family)